MRLQIILLLLASLAPRLYADTLVLRPSGAGTNTGLSVSGCTSNYDCVDDTTADGDTTHVYNSASTSQVLDTYALADHSTETGTISSVVIRAYLGAAGTVPSPTYLLAVRTHSTNYTHPASAAVYSSATYSAVSYTMTVNPNTGTAWTWTEIDDMEAGLSLARETAQKYLKCTQVEVEVTYSAYANSAPSVTFDNNFPTLSSGTVVANYNLIDADGDACDLTDYSTVAGVQYSADNSAWYDAAMGSGGDGLTGLAASASPGTDHKYAWNSATDLPDTEDGSVYLRMAPTDGQSTGTWVTSDAFAIDNKAPVVATAVSFAAAPVSGDSSFSLDAAFTDGNPGTNTYGYKLNGAGSYTTGAGDANTADPSAKAFSVALDGDDYFNAIICTHVDEMGNTGSSEDTSGKYVRPLAPLAPGLAGIIAESADLTINENTSENGASLYYVIKATYGAATRYVQADGTLGVTPVWRNNWAQPLTVYFGSAGSEVWFSAAAGNAQDPTPSAGENSASDYGPSVKCDRPSSSFQKRFQFIGSKLRMQGVTIQ